MLQIVSKKFFREGSPLHSTPQRMVLYTNVTFLQATTVKLPVGELATSTSHGPVSSVTATVTEHLEAEHLDGSRNTHIATSGEELIDDLADVLSFALNATFSRDHDLVRRLVPASGETSGRASPASLFRGTFESGRYVPEEEIEELRAFMTDLLELERSSYEAAMRAIRQIVRATQSAVDNPTRAYVDLVASLESLSGNQEAPLANWSQLDGRKRKLIDAALAPLTAEVADDLRAAIMEAERLGIKQRYVAVVLERVSPKFFREEAADAVRPVRGADLERAVKTAYDVRSQSVHALRELPDEASAFGDKAETIEFPSGEFALSLEGLARLARHVVRAFVAESPAGNTEYFDWRAYLPGKVMMRLAPQYWIYRAEGLDQHSAERYFIGLVDHTLDVLAGSDEGFQPLQGVMERIEELVPGLAPSTAKTQMIGMYWLWNALIVEHLRQPKAEQFLATYGDVLDQPSLTAFVVQVLAGGVPGYSTDQWVELAVQRRAEREAEKAPGLAPALDAGLQACAAEAAADAGDADRVRELADDAVQELPGNALLAEWESGLVAGESPELDLVRLMLGDEAAERMWATDPADGDSR